ncbi:CpaF family protein [Pseudomaricurvus alcaniphilus]|uniref:CpaF family protein n=1 Tax=Pseudomaricurvus alcaniphilus TaxID=1166482 RepID=UPI00140D8CD7|nr:CpaF family protein [Pseudomaricurvus alcaniphilus]NHN37225.1 CpaF family protein [Pseudomaricurvus alcaniphilus]
MYTLSRYERTHDISLANDCDTDYIKQLRSYLHNRIIDSMEDESVELLKDRAFVRRRLEEIISGLESNRRANLSNKQIEQLKNDVYEELNGLGPISQLMIDPAVTDILINGAEEIWVERNGSLTRTELYFDDEDHLRRFLDRIVSMQGRHLDARQPTIDTRLEDGSRLHAVIPPLCAKGIVVSIRRFHSERMTATNLVDSGFISDDMLRFLQIAINAGINTVIAGSAGAGKTSLLNAISGFIPTGERIVTVEETAELKLQHPHVIPLEARPANSDGNGNISLRDLVRTALRMRADRIIVGEVRGEEVLEMLQAMNIGHDGSLTTVHANSPHDVLSRLETLALMGDNGLNLTVVRQMIAASVQLIVQVMRFRDGSRRVVSISELLPGDDNYSVRELFHFENQGQSDEGVIRGQHVANGNQSVLAEILQSKGFAVAAFNELLQGNSR